MKTNKTYFRGSRVFAYHCVFFLRNISEIKNKKILLSKLNR